jgi:hypothetical protein
MRLTRGRLAKAVASPGILLTHTGAERERLWELAKLFMASYACYERTAGGRRIPVLAFLPVSR